MSFLSQKSVCEQLNSEINWDFYFRIYQLPRDEILREYALKNKSHLVGPVLDQSDLLKGACWRYFSGMDLEQKEFFIIKTYMVDFCTSIFAFSPVDNSKINGMIMRKLRSMQLNKQGLEQMIAFLLQYNLDPF